MNNYTKKLFFPISETVNLAAKGHPTLYCSVKYRNSNLEEGRKSTSTIFIILLRNAINNNFIYLPHGACPLAGPLRCIPCTSPLRRRPCECCYPCLLESTSVSYSPYRSIHL